MVQFVIGVIWGSFMLAGMIVSLVLVGEQVNKWIKKK